CTMSHTSNIRRQARRGAKQLRHQADEARNGVMHTVQKMGSEAVGAIRDGYDDLRETASDYVNHGVDRVESLEQSFEKQVKQHPMSSVLTCLGIGFLAGVLFSRR
ncbi:MAG TPA: hypothetical protein VGJ04_02735, partial [Pirellulales bacterium]